MPVTYDWAEEHLLKYRDLAIRELNRIPDLEDENKRLRDRWIRLRKALRVRFKDADTQEFALGVHWALMTLDRIASGDADVGDKDD